MIKLIIQISKNKTNIIQNLLHKSINLKQSTLVNYNQLPKFSQQRNYATIPTSPPKSDDSRFVIEQTFDPFLQDLSLIPNLSAFTFEGAVDIHIRPLADINKITLNSKALTYKTYSLKSAIGTVIAVNAPDFDEKEERVTFNFETTLIKGKEYTLHIEQDGILNDKLKGWQRAKYTGHQQEQRQMATTQMEPIAARMALPCIDEPARKSIFRVRVKTEQHLMVLGNMPEKQTEFVGDNRKIVHFMDTPLMSTQLLAFIVGEQDFVQTSTKRGTLVRALTPIGQSSNGMFALETAKRTLELQEDWFKVNQPLPKLDMIAISEFEAGAMENWGLVTYREVDLLIGPQASVQQQTRVATVVCHELAHQWFGNLVTMQWWNDLWLNESFATFIETLCTNTLFPEFRHLDSFVNNISSRALNLDSLKSSHPISVPIQRAQEVDEVFDAISQNKGCAVIRMFWEQIGNEKFMEGLRNYFIKHKQSNATKHELFKEWDISTKDNISQKLAFWINQTGFPLLEVTDAVVGTKDVTLTIRQSLQLESGDADPTDRKWFIPLQVLTNTHEHLYELTELTTKIKVPISGTWFIQLNSQGKSFVRVQQSSEILEKLLNQAKTHKLSTPNKSILLSDTTSLARSGKVDLKQLFNVLNNFRKDADYDTKTIIINNLKSIQKQISGDAETTHASNKYMFTVLQEQWLKLGYRQHPTDSLEDKKLRSDIIFNQLRVYNDLYPQDQDPTFIEFLNKEQLDILKNPNHNNIENDMKSTVFYNQIKDLKGEDKLKEITNLQTALTENYSKRSILSLIGHVDDSMKESALQWVLSIELQDFAWGLSSISNNNVHGFQVVKASVINQLETQKTKIGEAKMLLGSVYTAAFKGAYLEADIKEIGQFLDANFDQSFTMTFKQIKESMENNRRFQNYLTKSDAFKKEWWVKNSQCDK